MDLAADDEEAQATPLPPDLRSESPASLFVERGNSRVSSRLSTAPDMDKGSGGVVAQEVKIRGEDSQDAMGLRTRRRGRMKKWFDVKPKRNVTKTSTHRQEVVVEQQMDRSKMVAHQHLAEPTPGPQFTLRSRHKSPKASFRAKMLRAMGMGGAMEGHDFFDDSVSFASNFNPNVLIAWYLHWTFRTSFFFLFLSFLAEFFLFVVLFAGLIFASGKSRPECIQVGEETFGSSGEHFEDAFALSWTTFSTVGFGLVYPQVSTGSDVNFSKADHDCMAIAFLTSLESFVGVMFTGLCGAILFGKNTRILGEAQVVFSDPMVIRYGSGVRPDDDDDANSVLSHSKGDSQFRDNTVTPKRHNPCPVLEFRIVNLLHSRLGGEIVDAALTVIGVVEEKTACPTVCSGTLTTSKERMHGMHRLRSQISEYMKSTVSQTIDETEPLDDAAAAHHAAALEESITDELGSLAMASLRDSTRTNQTIDEGNAILVPRRIFTRMEVEPPDHPFFKRMWTVRHTLDATSPLLTAEARQLVERNNGFWPEELNSWQGVRRSVLFKQILVSLVGTCNVNASAVFAQKMYDFVDVNVGYSFANPLYKDSDGSLRVDVAVTNDVIEQPGEDPGEPFQLPDGATLSRRVLDSV